jgi:hypothetical protein
MAFRLGETRRHAELVETSYVKCSKVSFSVATNKLKTREPDSASHEHHTLFCQDTGRGTTDTAGFGWRGGSGV